jgi:hypothetical protein
MNKTITHKCLSANTHRALKRAILGDLNSQWHCTPLKLNWPDFLQTLHINTHSFPPNHFSATWTRLSLPENGGSTFLRNVGAINHYSVQKPKRPPTQFHFCSFSSNCLLTLPYLELKPNFRLMILQALKVWNIRTWHNTHPSTDVTWGAQGGEKSPPIALPLRIFFCY